MDFLNWCTNAIGSVLIAGVLLFVLLFGIMAALDGVNTCFTPAQCAAEGNP